jgi:DNA-binding beta-propeller fold protein YncE
VSAGRRLAAAALALAAAAQPASGSEPRYRQRLVLPVADDAIGYGHCVTADVHTGEVFVCDPRTNRILIFDADGFFDFQIPGGDEFSSAEDVAVDPDGLLLVLGVRGGRRALVELDFDGVFRRELPLVGLPAGAPPPRLTSIALGPAGDRIYAVDAANRTLWLIDRDGLVVGSADLGAGLRPRDLPDLALGHVDAYGETVLVAVPSGGEILLFDRDGKARGRTGRKGGARCQLGYPTAAALDARGELWILDQQRMLLLRWRVEGDRCLSEHIGIGDAPGYLYYPYDLALDARGRLYIAQSYDGRVQAYDGLPPASGGTEAATDRR